MPRLRLGTRGSELALFQARAVAALLERQAQVDCEIVIIKTSGDRMAEATLSQIGGKRLFVKEIEDALLAGEVEIAVHSSKDMPAALPPGLRVGAVLPREDPHDAVVLAHTEGDRHSFADVAGQLGPEPRIGTSSIRRTAQLVRQFPRAQFLPVRGNLGTRLRKLDAGDYDALILAAAGLKRLECSNRIAATVPADVCVPAPGQGIIAVEIRDDDGQVERVVSQIDDGLAAAALRAERAVVARLGGGCQMPIGAFANVSGDIIDVQGVVISPDGTRLARGAASGATGDAERIGIRVAEQLLSAGAGEILADVQRAHAAVEGIQP